MSGLTPEQEWEWRRPEHHREGVLWAEIDRLRKYHAELDGAFRAWRQEHRDELEAQCERADRAEAELDRLRERIAVLDSAILEWRAEEGRQELVRERADRAQQAIREVQLFIRNELTKTGPLDRTRLQIINARLDTVTE